MNEFSHKVTGPGIHPRVHRMQRRRVRYLHSHRHHRLGGSGRHPRVDVEETDHSDLLRRDTRACHRCR
jgi:hypothetical protein